MKYDWKDSLLFGFGFVSAIGVLVALERGAGIHLGRHLTRVLALGIGFGPIALRRSIFGSPDLPEPRSGVFASLMSIVGLFATLVGTVCLLIGGLGLASSLRGPPDFEAEVRKYEGSAPEIEITVVGEDPAVTAEKKRKREEADAAYRVQRIADERQHWERSKADGLARDLQIFVAGIGLLALGSLATWARYPRRA